MAVFVLAVRKQCSTCTWMNLKKSAHPIDLQRI